jgi:hypothetical protein
MFIWATEMQRKGQTGKSKEEVQTQQLALGISPFTFALSSFLSRFAVGNVNRNV